MGKANLPCYTATEKQYQVVSVTFIATEWFFQLKKILKVFSTLAGGSVNPTAENIVSGPLVQP